MSFTNRYAITNINLKDETKKLSLSIDESNISDNEQEILPVLLLIPNKEDHEHEHIQLSKNDLKVFKNILSRKGGFFLNTGWYRLETHLEFQHVDKDYLLKLDTFMKEDHESTNFIHLCSYFLTKDNIKEIYSWIEDYDSLRSEELLSKYKFDLENKG